MKCEDLDPREALKLWDEMQPLIVAALAYDHYASTTPEKLKLQVESGFARVLACSDGTQLVSATLVQLHRNTEQERILHVVCTAGSNADAWLVELTDKLQEIADDQDAAGITMAGRPGWTKKLRQFGYRTDQIIMRANTNGRREQVTAGEQQQKRNVC